MSINICFMLQLYAFPLLLQSEFLQGNPGILVVLPMAHDILYPPHLGLRQVNHLPLECRTYMARRAGCQRMDQFRSSQGNPPPGHWLLEVYPTPTPSPQHRVPELCSIPQLVRRLRPQNLLVLDLKILHSQTIRYASGGAIALQCLYALWSDIHILEDRTMCPLIVALNLGSKCQCPFHGGSSHNAPQPQFGGS